MSRSGYSQDCDNWHMIMWRGAVASSIRGARGQAFLKEMLVALDALPEKKLIAGELEEKDGAVCAIGAVGKARGLDMAKIDPDDPKMISETFGVAGSLAYEIMYENDEMAPYWVKETPDARFARMRRWVESHIHQPVDNAQNR